MMDGATLSVDDPASQPFMTGVGGTSLSGTLSSFTESAWHGAAFSHCYPRNRRRRGREQYLESIPSYQSGVKGSPASSTRSANVPDVALNADPNSGYDIYELGNLGGWSPVAGTKCRCTASWAAFTALVNQQRQATSSDSFGFANPTLYELEEGATYEKLV